MNHTDTALFELTQTAVRALINIGNGTHCDIVKRRCAASAETIGTMMAPQLYGNRIHGIGNATSVVIRSCTEALFWLEFDEQKDEDAIRAVTALRDALATPGTRCMGEQMP